jgi:peptidoglycan/xylan/chitin deacetylase (PgdA/CDA1 family)
MRRRERRLLANRSPEAVFLCWHSLDVGAPPFLGVAPELFDRQLALLRRMGYRSGGSAELAALLAGRRLDAPVAFLTFDDGFVDNFVVGLPILEAHGMGALIYILPPAVDAGGALAWAEVEHHHRARPDVMQSMTWPMVERMAEAGTEFGNHTLSHPHLHELGEEALHEELLEGRRRIVDRLGACRTVAYPFGDWTPRVATAAAATGHDFGFTMPRGGQRTADRLTIPRIAVDARDDERRLRVKLAAAGRTAALSGARPALQRGRRLLLGR